MKRPALTWINAAAQALAPRGTASKTECERKRRRAQPTARVALRVTGSLQIITECQISNKGIAALMSIKETSSEHDTIARTN